MKMFQSSKNYVDIYDAQRSEETRVKTLNSTITLSVMKMTVYLFAINKLVLNTFNRVLYLITSVMKFTYTSRCINTHIIMEMEELSLEFSNKYNKGCGY